MYGYSPTANSYLQMDRPFLSKQYQIVNSLCSLSKDIVSNAISNFNTTKLVSNYLLSRNVFIVQANAIINQLIQETPLDFRRLVSGTALLLECSLIPTIFGTDWTMNYGNVSNDYVLQNIPRYYANRTCNCVISNKCYEPLKIGPPDLFLPGLMIGCLPIDGLRVSTFECLFSSNCIDTILSYLEYYTFPDKSYPTNFSVPEVLPLTINPLNESMPSRFLPTTLIGTIIDQLFIEKWENSTNYENYFDTCAPEICNYKFNQRTSVLYIITSLLSLYGGLTVALRFIVWNSIRFLKKKRSTRRVENTTVVSLVPVG